MMTASPFLTLLIYKYYGSFIQTLTRNPIRYNKYATFMEVDVFVAILCQNSAVCVATDMFGMHVISAITTRGHNMYTVCSKSIYRPTETFAWRK